jgi:hypothetical protein
MMNDETRKLSYEPCLEETIRLDPEWLRCAVACDAKVVREPADTATTREAAFDAPTSQTRYLHETPEKSSLPVDDFASLYRRDLERSTAQFAEFGWERTTDESVVVRLGLTREVVDDTHPAAPFVTEYLAIHERCIDGLSVADIAAANAEFLESTTRAYIADLALSYWDLYEVVGHHGQTWTLVSRIDSRVHVVRGLDREVEVGDVVVARVVKVGDVSIVGSVVLPTHRQQAELYDTLRSAFHSRSWSGFMRSGGAEIVLDWAVRRLV